MSRNKYGNRKTELDGYVFDSRREANRYLELKLLEKAGEITNVELQPEFVCRVNGRKICSYFADFRYQDVEKGVVIEDVKSVATRKIAVYILKKKLVEALYEIEIVEV